jgi:hypothetical protein
MTKGYLLWFKTRSTTKDNKVYDSARGVNKTLVTNTTDPQVTQTFPISVSTTGFTIPDEYDINTLNDTLVAWTFRKQPKFFDVQVFNGDPSSFVTVNHNLGAVPGFIVYKRISGTPSTNPWYAWHRTFNANDIISLNTINAKQSGVGAIDAITSTSTTFYDSSGSTSNQYVAYFFAHNAGGFGLTGTDNVISCDTFTTDGSGNATVDLGYEPQWVLYKGSSFSSNWVISDTMRGFNVSDQKRLFPNTSGGEDNASNLKIKSTGFSFSTSGPLTYIYIAIRRGPMKVPTVGTSVFSPITYAGANGAEQNISAGFPVDMDIIKIRNDNSRNPLNHARLMGGVFLSTNATGAEQSYSDNIVSFNNAQNVIGLPVTGGGTNEINGASTSNYIGWAMRRAPSFMDVVCYTGTGASTLAVTHNLQVVPELIILKYRQGTSYAWKVTAAGLTNPNQYYLNLNSVDAETNYTSDFIYNRTATTFTVNSDLAQSGWNWVVYLFATCAGVSKVGSYTGNGTTQTIDCGLTAGARFVLIKRTDASGGWYVYDTARGMTVLTDPYLFLNNTDAEAATLGSVTTVSTGFALNSTILAAINVSGGTYIFLAIA